MFCCPRCGLMLQYDKVKDDSDDIIDAEFVELDDVENREDVEKND